MLPQIKSAGVSVAKRFPVVRKLYRGTRTMARSRRYNSYRREPINRRIVIFEAFSARSFAGSPRAVYEAMLNDGRFADHRFVWVFRDPAVATGEALLHDPRTSIVRLNSDDYFRSYAVAGTWIGNSIAPAELTPRAGQRYIQCWHGTPLKRVGMDIVDETATATNGKPEIDATYAAEGKKFTDLLSGSSFTTAAFATAFGLSGQERAKIREVGNPRNDRLVHATAADATRARDSLGIDPGKRVILYAPTWRDDQHSAASGYTYRSPLDPARLRAELGDSFVLLYRAHYLVTNQVDFTALEGFAVDVSRTADINNLYLAADVMVTDYSSALFDYCLLDRPMVFFMYDLQHYEQRLRGFYLDPSELPGPVVATQEELTAQLRSSDLGTRYASSRATANSRFNTRDDGGATARVIDFAFPRDS